ncbi:MAG TPA: GyrI-like domain-containing protein [Tepidisphaeraceae bacterium]|jgi:effector-binding domain-containing protein|nr:GyrI-like domain-containing protein [Tepidisphaeraceae bacterium]
MSHRLLILPIFAALAFAASGCQLHNRAADAGFDLPPAPSAATLPYSVSAMHVQFVGGKAFLYSPARVSFNDEASAVAPVVASLKRLTATGQISPADSILLVYHDPSEDPAVPFDLEIGMPLRAAPTLPPPGFQVRPLPAFRCATLLYRGPLKLLNKAYDKLILEMIERGLVPSEETRENYLVWDEPDSPRNVVQIEVGIR